MQSTSRQSAIQPFSLSEVKLVKRLLLVIAITYCGNSILDGRVSELSLFGLSDGFEAANPRIVISAFTAGRNEIISQMFYSAVTYPRNVAFRSAVLNDGSLRQTWLSEPLESTNIFSVGEAMNSH